MVIFISIVFAECNEPKFKTAFYKDQHELLNRFVFDRPLRSIRNLEETDKARYLKYDTIDNYIQNISNIFFDSCFLSGNFSKTKLAYLKLKADYKHSFSDSNLFLPETLAKIHQLSEDSIGYNDFDLLFKQYVQLRCFLSSNLRACKNDAENYMYCKIVVDTIKTADGLKVLHFYDNFLIPKEYLSCTISKVLKNGKDLLPNAVIENKSYLSFYVPFDDRKEEIKIKTKYSFKDYSYEFWTKIDTHKFAHVYPFYFSEN